MLGQFGVPGLLGQLGSSGNWPTAPFPGEYEGRILGQVEEHEVESSRPAATTVGHDELIPPYVSLIRSLIDLEHVEAARKLLSAAIQRSPAQAELVRLARVLAPSKVSKSSRRDRDRTAEHDWLLRYSDAYRSQWVALDGSVLLAAAPSLKDLIAQLKTLGVTGQPLVHRVS